MTDTTSERQPFRNAINAKEVIQSMTNGDLIVFDKKSGSDNDYHVRVTSGLDAMAAPRHVTVELVDAWTEPNDDLGMTVRLWTGDA